VVVRVVAVCQIVRIETTTMTAAAAPIGVGGGSVATAISGSGDRLRSCFSAKTSEVLKRKCGNKTSSRVKWGLAELCLCPRSATLKPGLEFETERKHGRTWVKEQPITLKRC
jgi:hypothetical protein